MKKIILLFIVGFTSLMAIEFAMTESGLYPYEETQTPNTTPETPTSPDNWVGGASLPTKTFNVLDYGLKGDGVTDDSAALKALAENTNVTNWYFPAGKTFRLYGIDIPPHVNTVWGAGTLQTIYKNETYPKGVFFLTKRPDTHLLIDGINFTSTTKTIERVSSE